MNLHTNGLLARRCYYTLVSVLDAIYDEPDVAEHTGEVVETKSNIMAGTDIVLGTVGDLPHTVVDESKLSISPWSS